MKRFICTLSLFLSTFVLAFSLHAELVNIPDPNLRKALRHTLGLRGGAPITVEHMQSLTELRAVGADIMDLSGLEQATRLRKIHFGSNLISDLSPLAALPNLESVNLRGNQISDLSPLRNLTNLTYLKLWGNKISNIAPLSHLVKLEYLNLYRNQIKDIRPLANLVQLTYLDLNRNEIRDVRPLANLIRLEVLLLVNNAILDHSALDGLSLTEFTYDTIGCDMMPLPLAPRIEERTFPSLFTAWSDKAKWPSFDLIFCCPRFDSGIIETDNGFQFRTPNLSWDEAIRIRDAYLAENPTMVFLHGLSVIWSDLDSLAEDSPYWLRDERGEILPAWNMGLMNLNHPGWQQRMIDIAVTIDQCGLYDGIFIDGWSEWHNARRGQLEGQIAILRGIREQVRDDFLIMVNTNDYQAPASAPYINGLFMENGFPGNRNTAEDIEDELLQLENTLKWAEATLLEPRIIGVEGTSYEDEPPDTARNTRWMRAITTLTLTFSDGYVAFPLRGGPFYEFWNADLGRPVGEKGQLYQDKDGLYIREFTNGWAVYNHSGAQQPVIFDEEVQGVASGWKGTHHVLPDLDGEMYLHVNTKKAGDVNSDGVVNILDLTLVAQALGTDKPEGDVNGDGVINVIDLVFVAEQF